MLSRLGLIATQSLDSHLPVYDRAMHLILALTHTRPSCRRKQSAATRGKIATENTAMARLEGLLHGCFYSSHVTCPTLSAVPTLFPVSPSENVHRQTGGVFLGRTVREQTATGFRTTHSWKKLVWRTFKNSKCRFRFLGFYLLRNLI